MCVYHLLTSFALIRFRKNLQLSIPQQSLPSLPPPTRSKSSRRTRVVRASQILLSRPQSLSKPVDEVSMLSPSTRRKLKGMSKTSPQTHNLTYQPHLQVSKREDFLVDTDQFHSSLDETRVPVKGGSYRAARLPKLPASLISIHKHKESK